MTFESGNVPILCPQSKARLIQHGEQLVSLDPACRLAYAIVDNIPCMIVEQATQLSVDDWKRIVGDWKRIVGENGATQATD